MTTVIDERVVEMKFDNAEFEKNVAQSMSTLDKLKAALNFKSADSLEDLGKATKAFSLSNISDSISEVTSKFSAMEIVGITALMNITNKAVDAGTALVKSLTIDQVTEGFDKYASKTSAVQTIMAATRDEFSSEAEQMAYVNEQMDKLMWFTDETSYNFLDMASNIGKFTNNGIKLDKAVTAMQGIAQWAGVSGANVTEASRAMYNISQAMGAGAMKLMDWKSIENANMATMEFKKTAAETAVEMGTLNKVAEGLYSTLDGKTFTLKQFSTELKSGWFTADVITSTLAKYGDFTNMLYEAAEATGYTATELLSMIDKYKQGTLDLAKYSEDAEIPMSELKEYMDALSDSANDLGMKSFKASQEAKTFVEAIASAKDAVSSQWMKTFELIFGDYVQAKALWTGLANAMWDVFAGEGERRNETLSMWTERTALVEAFVNVLNLAYRPLMVFREAWHSLFPSRAADRASILDEMTRKLRDFTELIQPSDMMLNNLYRTLRGLFHAGKLIVDIFVAIIKAVFPVTNVFGSLLEIILAVTGIIGDLITNFVQFAEQSGMIAMIGETIANVFWGALEVIKEVAVFVGSTLLVGFITVFNIIYKAIRAIDNFIKTNKTLQNVLNTVGGAIEKVRRFINKLLGVEEKSATTVKKMEKSYAGANKAIAETGTLTQKTASEVKKSQTIFEKIINVVKSIPKIVAAVVLIVLNGIKNIGLGIFNFFKTFSENFRVLNADSENFFDTIKAFFLALLESLGEVGTKIKDFFSNLGIDMSGIEKVFSTLNGLLQTFIEKVTVGRIAAVVLSIFLLTLAGSAVTLTSKIGEMVSAISGLFGNINKFLKKQFSKSSIFVDISKSFALIAGSLALLTYVDQSKLNHVTFIMGSIAGVMTTLAIAVTVLSGVLKKNKLDTSVAGISTTIIKLAGAFAILAAAVGILSKIQMGNGDGAITKEDMLAWVGRIGVMISMMASLVTAAIALAKFAPVLSVGARTLIFLSASVLLLTMALNKMSDVQINNMDAHWKAYATLFAGIALMAAAASKVKFTGGLGLVLVAEGVNRLIPAIKMIVEAIKTLPFDDIKKLLQENFGMIMVALCGMFLVALTAFGAFDAASKSRVKTIYDFSTGKRSANVFTGLSGAILGLGAGIFLVAKAFESIQKTVQALQNGGQFDQALEIIHKLIVFIGTFAGSLILVDAISKLLFKSGVGDTFAKLGVAIVALGVGMLLVSKGLEMILKTGADANYGKAAGVMIVLGVTLAVLAGVAGTAQKAMPAIAAVMAAVIGLGVMIGELAIMSMLVEGREWEIIEALAAMGVIAYMLWKVLQITADITEVNTGAIASIAGAILVLSGTLIILSSMPDMGKVGLATLSLVAIMATLSYLLETMSKMKEIGKGKTLALAAATLAMVGVAASISMLAKYDWPQLLAAAGFLSLTFAALIGGLLVLDKFGGGGIGLLKAGEAIAIMSGSMVLLAAALKLIAGLKWDDIKVGIITMGVMLGIFVALSIAAAAIGPFALALEAVATAMISFAASAAIFSLAAIGIGVAMDLMAAAVVIFAFGLNMLTPALASLSELPLLDIAAGLMEIAKVGIAFIGSAVGVALLGAACVVLAAGLTLLGVAVGIVALGLLGLLAVLKLFGVGFEEATNKIKTSCDNVIKGIKQFFRDMLKAFTSNPMLAFIKTAATKIGLGIGGKKHDGTGILGGIAKPLGWGCPVEAISDLLNDIGRALGDNSGVVAAAKACGDKIGSVLGLSTVDSAGGIIGGFMNTVGGLFGNLFGGITNKYDTRSSTSKNKNRSKMNELLGIPDAKEEGGIIAGLQKLGKELGIDYDTTKKFEGLLSGDFLPTIEDLTDGFGGAGGAAGDYGDAVEEAGKKSKSAKEQIKDLASTLEGQMDIFSKFEMKTEVSAEQMLENMRSQLDGFASWSHRMSVLAIRGMDKDLLQKLAELGPKGYETMNAFYQMTDEQLQEANQLFQTSLAMPQKAAEVVGASFQYAGDMAVQGWSNALNAHIGEHVAIWGYADDQMKAFCERMGIASPSTKFYEYAVYCIQGFINGLLDENVLMRLRTIIVNVVCFRILEDFRTELDPQRFYTMGMYVVEGLASGISDNASSAISAAETLATTVGQVIHDVLEIGSPSELTKRFGLFTSQGLAIGITEGAGNVYNAAKTVAENGVNGFYGMGQRIEDAINDTLDFNPVITPMLDLSYMKAQMQELNSLMNAAPTSYGIGQNEGVPYVNNINYTQNNYSPKALSRVEIYRDTRNQLSMVKGVIRRNG